MTDENGDAARSVIDCTEYVESRTAQQIAADQAAAERRYPLFGVFAGGGDCDGAPAPALRPKRISARGAPTVVVVGARDDPATPYENAQAVAGQLAEVRLITYEGAEHGAYAQDLSPCVDGAVDAYLATGALPIPDLICPA